MLKESNAEVEVKVDALETKDEAGHLKPEVLDVKESRVASLKRNLSFSKMKKMFSRGEASGHCSSNVAKMVFRRRIR